MRKILILAVIVAVFAALPVVAGERLTYPLEGCPVPQGEVRIFDANGKPVSPDEIDKWVSGSQQGATIYRVDGDDLSKAFKVDERLELLEKKSTMQTSILLKQQQRIQELEKEVAALKSKCGCGVRKGTLTKPALDSISGRVGGGI